MKAGGEVQALERAAKPAAKPALLAEMARAPNGFDTIRLIAAAAVILSHAFPLTGIAEPLETLTGGQTSIGTLSVSAFFLISGYLIPASLDRGSLTRYAVKRVRRIMPALVVAVLVCALIVGPLVSTLSPAAYFSDPGLLRFLGNAVFLPVGYELPGAFADNPLPAVNGSLWSLRYEMACYIGVPALLVIARLRKLAVIAAWLASFAIARLGEDFAQGLAYHLVVLADLFRFFGMGMVFYLFADRLPLRRDWAWIAFALFLASLASPLATEGAALLGSYALMTFAYMCGPRFRALTAKGDISYGVYVYAFPIQQLLVPLSLGIGGVSLGWAVNSALALPLAALAGLASWLLIERPVLQYRRRRVVAA